VEEHGGGGRAPDEVGSGSAEGAPHGDTREALVATLSDAAILTDADGVVTGWNSAAEAAYGIRRAEALGRRLDVVLERWRGRISDAQRVPPGPGTGGETEGMFGRRASDEQRLQAELIQAQKMEAIGQLVSGVAHELNNPLAAIVAFSQLIVRDPRLPDDLKHDAALLIQESDRTRRIVQNLLDFARQRPPERHPTPLRALVQSILDLQSYMISAARVEVELDIPDDLPPIPIDRAQMQQVLLNLTNNAIHEMRSSGTGGHLAIRARVEVPAEGGPVARIMVADDGPGVAPEHRDRLFVPFFTTKPPGEGTGLGLPVSFGIVAAHGGTLSYQPGAGGRGATFVVELPTVAAPDAPPPDAAAVPVAPTPPGGQAKRARVLVLDDEPSIRRFLAKALDLAGHEAIVASNGAQVLEIVDSEPIDAILCDHRMAGMSGTEVYEAVVARRPGLGERFVFMSGDVLNPDLLEFANARGIRLLAKPFDLEAVGRTVREILSRAADEDQLRG
jgi:signal transduction histidine kinase/ActR/RegA family two-component response regulator